MQSIFKFLPIYKERPWGGRAISRAGKSHRLPPRKKIGESWEISDRQGDESLIKEGIWKGKSIRWLLDEHGSFVMGYAWKKGQRFPLLIKLLDATERLSLQVHPPPSVASELGGDPKAEMWYFVDAKPSAAILAGLRGGVRREDFEKALHSQTLEPLIHRIQVQKGDAIFIPSGRIHAIDTGCLILEIQQNSDTTYRLYDWGRVGEDGRPRRLHVEQALRCIDFADFEPQLIGQNSQEGVRSLVNSEYFRVEVWNLNQPRFLDEKTPMILHVLGGSLEIAPDSGETQTIERGETVLLAAAMHRTVPLKDKVELVVIRCVF